MYRLWGYVPQNVSLMLFICTEIPGASVMRASEDKLKYILPNMVKQSIKVKFAKKK